MILYYLSKGNVKAAVSACRIREERVLVSTHSNEYPTEIKYERFIDYSASQFHTFLISHEEQLNNKSIEEIITEYEMYHENEMSSNPISTYGYGEAELSRAICLIFGFGCKQNFVSATKYLNKIYDGLKDDNERQVYYYSHYDAWHYCCCIKEMHANDIPINESITNITDILPCNEVNTLAAYYYRHEIRKAFEGNIKSGTVVGEALMESEAKVDNKYRMQIYHDDICALSYLKMAAGVTPYLRATGYIIRLTSDPTKKTFNWLYAYNLCTSMEGKLDSIHNPENDSLGKNYLIYSLNKGFENLTKTTSDEMTKRELNIKAQLVLEKIDA